MTSVTNGSGGMGLDQKLLDELRFGRMTKILRKYDSKRQKELPSEVILRHIVRSENSTTAFDNLFIHANKQPYPTNILLLKPRK